METARDVTRPTTPSAKAEAKAVAYMYSVSKDRRDDVTPGASHAAATGGSRRKVHATTFMPEVASASWSAPKSTPAQTPVSKPRPVRVSQPSASTHSPSLDITAARCVKTEPAVQQTDSHSPHDAQPTGALDLSVAKPASDNPSSTPSEGTDSRGPSMSEASERESSTAEPTPNTAAADEGDDRTAQPRHEDRCADYRLMTSSIAAPRRSCDDGAGVQTCVLKRETHNDEDERKTNALVTSQPAFSNEPITRKERRPSPNCASQLPVAAKERSADSDCVEARPSEASPDPNRVKTEQHDATCDDVRRATPSNTPSPRGSSVSPSEHRKRRAREGRGGGVTRRGEKRAKASQRKQVQLQSAALSSGSGN